MIMVTLGFSTVMGFHFLMFGSFYMLPISPCVNDPVLPSTKWLFAGKNNYYLLLIIGVVMAYVSILYLTLYDTKQRMTGKILIPLIVMYFFGVGLRGFGGFSTTSFREIWICLCGVLPELL
jgi:hypothetical protein